jgi:hypothetical protein
VKAGSSKVAWAHFAHTFDEHPESIFSNIASAIRNLTSTDKSTRFLPILKRSAACSAGEIAASAAKEGCELAVCCNIPALPCPASVMHCNSKSSVLHCTANTTTTP